MDPLYQPFQKQVLTVLFKLGGDVHTLVVSPFVRNYPTLEPSSVPSCDMQKIYTVSLPTIQTVWFPCSSQNLIFWPLILIT